jgi:hypothetical protein
VVAVTGAGNGLVATFGLECSASVSHSRAKVIRRWYKSPNASFSFSAISDVLARILRNIPLIVAD